MRLFANHKGKPRKYIFNPDFDNLEVEDVSTFFKAYESGNLSPFYKSETPLEDSEQKHIKILAGANHNRLVKEDIDTYSLVMYYAPWCQYSSALMPTFKELAQELVGESDLMIGMFDVDKNEAEDLFLVGTPVLRLYIKGNKEVYVDYNSNERDL